MPRRRPLRQCPRCGYYTREGRCCGIDLAPRQFKLSKKKIIFLRTLARRQKGLDDEEYHRILAAVTGGRCESTKQLRRRRDYNALVTALQNLPDVRRYERRAAA